MQGKMHSTNDVDSADVLNPGLLYVADSAFTVVTDSTLCATALAAHNSDAAYTPTELATPAASTVYVIRVGTRYVTWNPDFASGEYVHHAVWNSSFNIVGHYLY